MSQILPYQIKNCRFFASKSISPINGKNKSDYFYLPFPCISESVYNEWNRINRANSLLLGPCFVPNNWNSFPNPLFWKERRFREILQTIKGLIVHSKRVSNYLSKRSNTTDLYYKFKFLRPCTNLIPKYVEPFINRKIDILFYEKYADLSRRKQSEILIQKFNKTKLKIERIRYGNYTKQGMMKLANNTKFIIYFSFYDTGAISLKEIQNFGVFCFSHQKEFIINKKTSFYIPELSDEFNMLPAFEKIMKIIKKVIETSPNTLSIAKINQDINKCQRALDDLCNSIL